MNHFFEIWSFELSVRAVCFLARVLFFCRFVRRIPSDFQRFSMPPHSKRQCKNHRASNSFLLHFGKHFASVVDQICKQVPLKTDLTTNAKHKHSLESFRIGFSLILASNLDLGRLVATSNFQVCWALGPSWYRDGLHLSQEAFLAAISHWYSWISRTFDGSRAFVPHVRVSPPPAGTVSDFR